MEAFDRFKNSHFNLVITDDRMPDMSGMELVVKIKALSPRVPVIMITGFGTVNHAVEAMKNGASDYLLKPFSTDILKIAVEKACIPGAPGNGPEESMGGSGEAVKDKQIISRNPEMVNLLETAKTVAPSDATVLIQGESGTGKELLAYFIHTRSNAKNGPYVAVNCAALPDTLAESELFGHEKGSFTGATHQKKGKFELANQGTIILDEISEMSLPLQAKILRVLQEKQIDRVGGTRTAPMNARVISISNVDLVQAVQKGTFREDLFYRVNVIPLRIPPLRRRRDDIPHLVDHFIEKYSRMNKKEKPVVTKAAMDRLLNHPWKGNIRELENTMERAVLIGKDNTVDEKDLLLDTRSDVNRHSDGLALKPGMSVKEMEKKLIFQTLKQVNDNRTHAAEMLGISIRTLRNKLRDYNDEAQDHAG